MPLFINVAILLGIMLSVIFCIGMVAKGQLQREAILLSPGVSQLSRQCAVITFDYSSEHPEDFFKVTSQSNIVLWGISGVISRMENATSYVDLAPGVTRLKFITMHQTNGRLVLKSVIMKDRVCNRSLNNSDLGNVASVLLCIMSENE